MIRWLVNIFGLVVSILLTACYLIGLSAQWIAPDSWSVPTYFVMGMPIWVVMMWCCVIAWLCGKRWVHALIFATVMVVTFGQWRNIIVMNKPTNTDNETIKILTFNTHIFNNHNEEGFEKIAKFIEESNADIVCLQEFGYYHRYGASKREILKFFDAIYPYRHLWFKNQNKWGENGLATFSRYPIVAKKKIEYTSADNISIYSDIVIGNDTVRVINNHLESNKLDKEDRKFAQKLIDEKNSKQEILTAGKHVGNRIASGAINRMEQAKAVREVIESTNYKVIALGDFNDVALSYAYNTIGKDLQNAYAKGGWWGYHWTYNKGAMFFAIDHILVDEKFVVVDSDVHKEMKVSDHYPLSCVIEMP